MDKMAVNSNVILERDWRKVSLTLIRSNGGQVKEMRLINLPFVGIN